MLIHSIHNHQITSINHQIITNHQIPMAKYYLVIENWNYVGNSSQIPPPPLF
jgi:hypothetical protein